MDLKGMDSRFMFQWIGNLVSPKYASAASILLPFTDIFSKHGWGIVNTSRPWGLRTLDVSDTAFL